MNKEASAKHILMKGDDARTKLVTLKAELEQADDVSTAFSELASFRNGNNEPKRSERGVLILTTVVSLHVST